jgi:hypothetical protein
MNELSVYERVRDPLEAVREMGNAIAKSRMFGCESVEQGMVFAWECFARKCSPLSLTETYHVIDGKLSMRADAMLARFIEAGGNHEILERSPDRASVILSIAGQSVEFSISWQEAQEEGLDQSKKGTKTNWSTPRRRMQMLWARVISDGVRAMAPQVCAGKYTPEDFGQVVESDSGGGGAMTVDGSVAAEYEVKQAPQVQPQPQPQQDTVAGECTSWQRGEIGRLFDVLQLSADQQATVLRKRGVASLRSLAFEQASELLTNLGRKAEQLDGKSKQPEQAHEARVTGPASQGQLDELKKDLLPKLAQTNPDLYAQLTAKIRAFGKLADLSFDGARDLIRQIREKNLDAFFGQILERGIPVAGESATPDP